MKRPFWLHQIAEYVIGIALVGSGLQSQSPAVPAVLGGLVLLNAACADGPIGAFRAIGRRAHRIFDIVLLVVGVVATAIPGLDLGTRIVQGSCIIVFATVVLNSDYSPARERRSSASTRVPGGADRADEIGRSAGRAAGSVAAKARTTWRAKHNGEGESGGTT